jgi:hypothetical protein
MIVSTDYVANPHDIALYVSAVLAADKGIPSDIVSNDSGGFDVVTDENKVFRFCRK